MRLFRRRRAGGTEQAGVSGIAAGAHRDFVGDLPGIFQCGRQHAGRALAQSVVAAAAIERADRDLEADAAAVAGRTDGRTDHLRAERGAHHSGRDARRRTAARPAGRAAQVMRVAGAARLAGGKFGGDGLSHDHGAGFAQRGDARGIALGTEACEQWRAVLGRHVGGLDDVLDADRHAVDLGQRPAFAPAGRGPVGGRARAGEVEIDEGADLGFERREIGKAAFEKIARGVGAARKAWRGRKIWLG